MEYAADIKGFPHRARYVVIVSLDPRVTKRIDKAVQSVWVDSFADSHDTHDNRKLRCTNPGCGLMYVPSESGDEDCKCHESSKLRFVSIIESRYKLWRHLMGAFGLRQTDNTAQALAAAKENTLAVATLLPDAFFGFNAAGSLRTLPTPQPGEVEPAVIVSMDTNTWPTANEVAANKNKFPPAIYPFLVWSCCELPYTPRDEPRRGCKMIAHHCEVCTVYGRPTICFELLTMFSVNDTACRKRTSPNLMVLRN